LLLIVFNEKSLHKENDSSTSPVKFMNLHGRYVVFKTMIKTTMIIATMMMM
jgi:hypothetical protein